MPFDSEVVHTPARAAAPLSLIALIDGVSTPEPIWAAEHPERALAFLMVAPQDCPALDAL